MKKLLAACLLLVSVCVLAQAQPVPPPPDGYYRHGLHNDRYPPHRYYWHPEHGRYYPRYYVATYRHARCADGTVRPASRTACRRRGGVRYYF